MGTEKNTVEASATVIMTSPAPFTACSSISLPRPDSPAPCAWVAFLIPRAVPVNGKCRARPTARTDPLIRPEPLTLLLPLFPFVAPIPVAPWGALAAATPS